MGSGGVDAAGDVYRTLVHRDIGELVARRGIVRPRGGICIGRVPAGTARRSDGVGGAYFEAFSCSGGEVDERPYDAGEQADLSANLPARRSGMLVDYFGARFIELELATVGKGYCDAAGRSGRDAIALVDSGPDRRRKRRSAALDRDLTAQSGHRACVGLRVSARCGDGKDAGQNKLRDKEWFGFADSHSLFTLGPL
jgi:hypothetical protein